MFSGDINEMILAKTRAVQHAQKETEMKKLPPNPQDNFVWQGHDIKPISLENEINVWDLLSHECSEALSKYPQTLEEDI